MLDIIGLEIGGNGRAKTLDGGQELLRQRPFRGFARSRLGGGNGCGRCAAADHAEGSRAALQDGAAFQGFRSIVFSRFVMTVVYRSGRSWLDTQARS